MLKPRQVKRDGKILLLSDDNDSIAVQMISVRPAIEVKKPIATVSPALLCAKISAPK
jgi:hypothetical protein